MRTLLFLLLIATTLQARAATYLLLSQTNALAAGITNQAKAYTDAHSGGSAPVGTVVASGTNTAGMVLTAADDKGTNGVWSDPIWLNRGDGIVYLFAHTNALSLGNQQWTNNWFFAPYVPVLGLSDTIDSAGDFAPFLQDLVVTGNGSVYAQFIAINNNGTRPPIDATAGVTGIAIFNDVGSSNSFGFYDRTSGGFGVMGNAGTLGDAYIGSEIGLYGDANSAASFQVGTVGRAKVGNYANSVTNVGVAGISEFTDASQHIRVGLYGETSYEAIDPPTTPNFQNSVLLLDNKQTGDPLITARTNNGTTVFQVGADGSIAAGTTNQWKTGDYADGNVVVTVNGTDHKLGPLTTNAPAIAAGSIAAFVSSNVLGAATSAQLTNAIGGVYRPLPVVSALTHAGTVSLDFTPYESISSITSTGNMTIASANLAAQHTYTLKITGASTNSLLTLPAGWGIYGGGSTNIPANVDTEIRVRSWGTTDANVRGSLATVQ